MEKKINHLGGKNRILRGIVILLCSILSSMAIIMDKTYLSNENYIHQFGIYLVDKMNRSSMNFVCAFIFVAVFIMFRKYFRFFQEFSCHKMSIFVSFLLSVIMMIGDGFTVNGRLTFMVDNGYQFAVSLFIFIGYWLFFYILVCIVDDLYERLYKRNCKRKEYPIDDKKMYLIMIAILFIFWLPYLIAYFPGSVPHDGMTQISQALGAYELKNDHPVISTLLIGVFIRVGRLFGGDYAAIFFGVLVQTLFVASAFSFLLLNVFKYSNNKKLLLVSGLFFAVYPTWGMMVEAFMKDSLYVGFFTYFCVFFIKFMMNPDTFTKKISNVVCFVISLLGVVFWRVNGMHILLATTVVFLFARVKWLEKIKIAGCIVGVCAFYIFMVHAVYPLMGVSSQNNYTGIHIMLQQTARYINFHSDEVTEEEKAAISGVADYDHVKEDYNPNETDFAVRTYRINATDEQKQAYINAWKQMFFKHPITYIESVLNTTYQFYYIGDNANYWGEYQNYTKYEVNYCLPDLKDIQALAGSRNAMNSWAISVRAIPGINLLGRCGFYTWILIFLAGIFLKRGQINKFIAMAPLYINILLFCLVSPANGLHRYIWPVMAVVPLCVAISMARPHDRQEVKDFVKKENSN